jgi:hypothetical protein
MFGDTPTMFFDVEKSFSCNETIFSAAETVVEVPETIVHAVDSLVWASSSVPSLPRTIWRLRWFTVCWRTIVRKMLLRDSAVWESCGVYVPRQAEESVLYKVVAANLETFLARQQQRDRVVPRFVEREMMSFLECGILANGFLLSLHFHMLAFDGVYAENPEALPLSLSIQSLLQAIKKWRW